MTRKKRRVFLVSAGLCLLAISTWLYAKPYILGDPSSGALGYMKADGPTKTARVGLINKEAEDEILIPKSWGHLKGSTQGEGTNEFYLFFEATDGTIYIANGFIDRGECILRRGSQKIKRSAQ